MNESPSDTKIVPYQARPLLIFLEGVHDIGCLKQFSRMLHADDPALPELCDWEQAGQILFVPVGGSNLKTWVHRLQLLNHPELHIYDREDEFVVEDRAQIVKDINRRLGCHAVLTQKRALENYLHPDIVSQVFETEIHFGDQDDVAEAVSRELLRRGDGPAWEELPPRSRRRLKDRAKKRLNKDVLLLMTPDLLVERDPQGEVLGWMNTIKRLASD